MPCHAIPVQYIAYAKFSFGHHPNPSLSKFAQVDVLRDALKDVLLVVEIFSAQSEAREPRTRNCSLAWTPVDVWKLGLNGPWRETETTREPQAIREELYWCLYNSSLLAVRGDPQRSKNCDEIVPKPTKMKPSKKHHWDRWWKLSQLIISIQLNRKYLTNIHQNNLKHPFLSGRYPCARHVSLVASTWLSSAMRPALVAVAWWIQRETGRVEPPVRDLPMISPTIFGFQGFPGFSWIFSCFSVDSN